MLPQKQKQKPNKKVCDGSPDSGHIFRCKILSGKVRMRLVILYGSQTGTAQDMAEQIWRESKRWGCSGPVLPMDDYPVQQLVEEKLVVFVVATTGNGDEPDNMRQSWKFLLRRSLPPGSLQRLQFACLGLGDSSYAKFNFAAKKLHKRLHQLGGTSLLPLGLCDDQHDHGLGATALPWIAQLWQKLQQLFPLRVADGSAQKAVFKWRVEVLEEAKQVADVARLQWPFKDAGTCFTLQHNERTTAPDHFQDVRLLRFEFPPNSEWGAGDVLQVRPWNSTAQVESFFALVDEHKLPFGADTVVQLSSAYEDMPLPMVYERPVTVGLLVKYVWDLSARPRQRAFELLALHCEDELEKEKLEEFTTAEGLDDVINYINRPRRTILEVLQDFRHATSKLTLPVLFELFGGIQTRSFSIASMPTAGTLDLLVAVVEYKTKLSTPRLGLCSNWLKSLPTGTKILGAIKPGTMMLPKDPIAPIIMVGPGTGIAPFRSIIQQREALRRSGQQIGPLIVFFGCRNKLKDFHFGNDFAKWRVAELLELSVAFSRDQEHKVYVQHLIKEQKDKLKELIRHQNTAVLIAGSSNNMPKAVKESFVEVLDGDEQYLEQMIKNKRYQEETWS